MVADLLVFSFLWELKIMDKEMYVEVKKNSPTLADKYKD